MPHIAPCSQKGPLEGKDPKLMRNLESREEYKKKFKFQTLKLYLHEIVNFLILFDFLIDKFSIGDDCEFLKNPFFSIFTVHLLFID